MMSTNCVAEAKVCPLNESFRHSADPSVLPSLARTTTIPYHEFSVDVLAACPLKLLTRRPRPQSLARLATTSGKM